ncbi:T9SS type A sorting domain-containing protein [Flavobacterium sp. AS60]|uniref:T9SS type A sorting domain-containing protein n=1 Tax=Flavobacterium anseongense TaxID=2910677 RepID=UPI001F23515A|nr:T9SS type A sorting domain-containing protein [Flavobacterium sp. AS60]MCF6130397.1 T9SS type A sorting domain-containing protein [Flavobacterium sp. AS60]
MKRKLLLILPMVLFTLVSNAQDHVWDFGNDTTNWPVNPGYNSSSPATTTIDGLTLISGGSVIGAISAASNTAFSDGFTNVNMMTVQSATGAPMPTKRGLSFPVNGPCTIKLWVYTSSTNRRASISDGTNELAFYLSASPSPYKSILVAYYTGGPGTIYVYTNNTMNFAKLSVETGLGIDDVKEEALPVFYTNGNQVFLSNVKSNTTVSIYSITGALVKTIKTNNDTSFELSTGLWIAKVKSEEGGKTVKLVVR